MYVDNMIYHRSICEKQNTHFASSSSTTTAALWSPAMASHPQVVEEHRPGRDPPFARTFSPSYFLLLSAFNWSLK